MAISENASRSFRLSNSWNRHWHVAAEIADRKTAQSDWAWIWMVTSKLESYLYKQISEGPGMEKAYLIHETVRCVMWGCFWTSLSGRHSKRLPPAVDCWFEIAWCSLTVLRLEGNESYRHKAEGWPTCQTSLVCRADLWLSVTPDGDWADVWKLDFQQFTPRDYANWGHLWPREI